MKSLKGIGDGSPRMDGLKKAVLLIRIGQHAGVIFAEDSITVPRDEAIDPISKRPRYHSCDGRK